MCSPYKSRQDIDNLRKCVAVHIIVYPEMKVRKHWCRFVEYHPPCLSRYGGVFIMWCHKDREVCQSVVTGDPQVGPFTHLSYYLRDMSLIIGRGQLQNGKVEGS